MKQWQCLRALSPEGQHCVSVPPIILTCLKPSSFGSVPLLNVMAGRKHCWVQIHWNSWQKSKKALNQRHKIDFCKETTARKLIPNALRFGLPYKHVLAAGLDLRFWESQEWKMEMAPLHLPFLQGAGSSSPMTLRASSHSENQGWRPHLPAQTHLPRCRVF